MEEGGAVVVVVGGFVVVGMRSSQNLPRMMWISSSAKLSSFPAGHRASKIICNERKYIRAQSTEINVNPTSTFQNKTMKILIKILNI